MRIFLYGKLALIDLLALLTGPVLGAALLNAAGKPRPALTVSLAIVPIYAILALNNGGFSMESLKRSIESIRRSVGAYMLAVLLIVTFAFALKSAQDVSRLAFGINSAVTLALLVTGRVFFSRIAFRRTGGAFIDELLIVDGRPIRSRHCGGAVISAQSALLRPDLADPVMLDRFGRLAARYDRIVIDSVPERSRQWAMMLKGANTNGEIVQDKVNAIGAIGVGAFDGRETLLIARKPLSVRSRMQKRLLDLAITVPLLIIIAPTLVLVAILIKLDSPGPALFRQDRVGRGNRWFKVLKFRSVRVDGSDSRGDRSTARDDARITRVGRFIRATSIDELPQLINVLLGNMSLVGPRPHALGSLAGEQLFWLVDERYWHCHQLKPGITGLAQVRGLRGTTARTIDLTDRLHADMAYINNWDVWRDITILFNTFRVLIHQDAY